MNIVVFRPRIETVRHGDTYEHPTTWVNLGVAETFRERLRLAWMLLNREADVLLPWYAGFRFAKNTPVKESWAMQSLIFALGAIGAALIALGGHFAPWGFLVALAGQPLWLIETYRDRKWGMFGMACWYTLAWGLGAWKHWGGV